MPKLLLAVGTKIRAVRKTWNYHDARDIPVGANGEIIGAGLDAQFGYYIVKFDGDSEPWLCPDTAWEVIS